MGNADQSVEERIGMQKVIITFLGDRGALETKYCIQGRYYLGRVFAEALHQFCEYDRMLVCVTAKAREKTWPVLESLQDTRIEPVDIPTGETTEEMWQTFRIIAGRVNEGDEVIFDITHGLRSLPFLVFLFAAYLKAAKSVKIRAVYYGALELQNRDEGKPSPVIDLSEFVSMLDWITATDRFIYLGLGNGLSDLVRNSAPAVADAINDTSLALLLSRPLGTMEAADRLRCEIEAAKQEDVSLPLPFALLSDKVQNAYTRFALADPLSDENTVENLRRQVNMVDWYVERQQYNQAATLWYEVLISLVAYACGLRGEAILDKNQRDKFEKALNNYTDPPAGTLSDAQKCLRDMPNAGCIVDLWKKYKGVRNDVAHTEMLGQSRSQGAPKLVNSIAQMRCDLKLLAGQILNGQYAPSKNG